MRQSTIRLRICVYAAEIEVKMMHASDVPTATGVAISGLNSSSESNRMINAGTITTPPPIPSRPARKPLAVPIATQEPKKKR